MARREQPHNDETDSEERLQRNLGRAGSFFFVCGLIAAVVVCLILGNAISTRPRGTDAFAILLSIPGFVLMVVSLFAAGLALEALALILTIVRDIDARQRRHEQMILTIGRSVQQDKGDTQETASVRTPERRP